MAAKAAAKAKAAGPPLAVPLVPGIVADPEDVNLGNYDQAASTTNSSADCVMYSASIAATNWGGNEILTSNKGWSCYAKQVLLFLYISLMRIHPAGAAVVRYFCKRVEPVDGSWKVSDYVQIPTLVDQTHNLIRRVHNAMEKVLDCRVLMVRSPTFASDQREDSSATTTHHTSPTSPREAEPDPVRSEPRTSERESTTCSCEDPHCEPALLGERAPSRGI